MVWINFQLILKFEEWGTHSDAVTICCLMSGKFGLGDKEIFSLSLSLKKNWPFVQQFSCYACSLRNLCKC